MRAKIISVAAVLFALTLVSPANAAAVVTISYQEPLLQLQLGYGSSSDSQKLSTTLARSLRFDAFGQRFDINLEENRSLLGPEQRASLGDRYQIYRGDIAGMPDSWVRLVIADGLPRGMLWDGTEFWAIKVAGDPSTDAQSAFMYRLADLQIAPGTLSCAGIDATKNGGEFAKAIMSEISANAAQGPGAASQIDIAVIGDFEFTSDKGASSNAEMITRMNNVDGIFSMQLGVQFNVGRIETFSSNNDPFTDQLDSAMLLDELSDYREATPSQNANGLSHLFTGRNLDTTTVGIAWTGALCQRRNGAGLTQATHDVTTDSLIAAHEFGHNFGAPHDGTSDSVCESETGNFLMATSINGSDQFSSCSITEMQDDVDRASCITPLPSTDVALVANGQPGVVLLGDPATVSFEVNSVGTDTASGVNVDVTIPAGVTLSSVSTTTGFCDSGAGGASCAIGTIAAGSGATVTLTVTTSTVGSATFDATITADIDANGNNNQATVQFDIDPAVDMISIAATTAQVALNGSTTIRPSVQNGSSITATNVTVTLTPDAGISIDSASWPPGNCSIADNVATCDAISLATQSANTLQIGITGTSEGNRTYAMSVSAAETDRDGANNDVSGQVTVRTAGTGSQGGEDSGGGSLGWLSLLFLALIIRARRSIAWPTPFSTDYP